LVFSVVVITRFGEYLYRTLMKCANKHLITSAKNIGVFNKQWQFRFKQDT